MNKYYQKAIPFSVLFAIICVAIFYVFFSIGNGVEFDIREWSDVGQAGFGLFGFPLFICSVGAGVSIFKEVSKKDNLPTEY